MRILHGGCEKAMFKSGCFNSDTYSFQNMGIIHTAKKYLVPELVKKKTRLKKEQLRLKGEERKLNKREEIEVI